MPRQYSCLAVVYRLCFSCVHWLLTCFRARSAFLQGDRFHVPHQSPIAVRATSMPDTIWTIGGLFPDFSQGMRNPSFRCHLRFSTLHQWFTYVRLQQFHMTQSCYAFFRNVHHRDSLSQRLAVVWSLPPQGDSGGPTSISDAALLRF